VEIIEGEIVVSGLENKAMPLIRYCTGDIGKLGEKCSCGRNTKTLEVFGRKDQVFNGMTELELGKLMDIEGVVAFKAGKKIKVIADKKIKLDGYEMEYVDDILPEESGKFRVIE